MKIPTTAYPLQSRKERLAIKSAIGAVGTVLRPLEGAWSKVEQLRHATHEGAPLLYSGSTASHARETSQKYAVPLDTCSGSRNGSPSKLLLLKRGTVDTGSMVKRMKASNTLSTFPPPLFRSRQALDPRVGRADAKGNAVRTESLCPHDRDGSGYYPTPPREPS